MKRMTLNLLGALAAGAALNLQLSTALAQGTGYALLTTFTNPTPAASDWFGWSAAAVGIDRVLIGAPHVTDATDTGAAYLFTTNGTLLTTFSNPTPAAYDGFGVSLAAVGTDRVLIGAHGASGGFGAAYLFSTNGALLTTFTNPPPAGSEGFGRFVAAAGTDRLLISGGGKVYLFRTNGTLLTTFTNPTPAGGNAFGYGVVAVGTDRVLIGACYESTVAANAGAAYLFSTNGALLRTFTNPTPAAGDYFGNSVAAVGTDRVLIGADEDDIGAYNAGVAFLFRTNGTLLTTFTNPTPAYDDRFGNSVAAVGTDRVLIGAPFHVTGAGDTGAAYLFSTNGALLATFTNPPPPAGNWFGSSVAAVGTDFVLIGAYRDDTGATDAGAAYLFRIQPVLGIRLTTTNTVAVSWPSPWTDWTLQQNTNGVASVNWSNAPGTIQDDGTNKTLIVNPPAGERFYRLFKPSP